MSYKGSFETNEGGLILFVKFRHGNGEVSSQVIVPWDQLSRSLNPARYIETVIAKVVSRTIASLEDGEVS